MAQWDHLYKPWTWPEHLKHGLQGIGDSLEQDTSMLDRYGAQGADFGNTGKREYGSLQRGLRDVTGELRDVATGKTSYAGEQLRQGLQQNQAAQQSMAAGASPANQAMAARNAATNMGRLGAGLSGQQALAGIQERQAAQRAWADALLQQRQQALQATLGGYGMGVQAGSAKAGVPTGNQILMGGLQGLGSAAMRG